MKTNLKLITLCYLLSAVGFSAFAQGTAFTYQGRLNDGANPANGSYDLRFALYDLAGGGNQAGAILTNTPTPVSNGLFMVVLDFGANIFTNANRFLEIAVRTNSGAGFTTLNPRQPLTPAPYSIFAQNVGAGGLSAGTYASTVTLNNTANNFSGSFTGNGASVSNVNAAALGGLSSSNFWQLGGNVNVNPASDFLGTRDSQPLNFRVEGRRALRLESATNAARGYGPNVIGGYEGNSVAAGVIGATIAGGGRLDPSDDLSHHITAHHGTIGGGDRNTVNGEDGTVAGGGGNVVSANYSSIAGGLFNWIQTNALMSTIGGGLDNTIQTSAFYATIGGGTGNTIQTNTDYATIGGGGFNVIQTNSAYGFLGGGIYNNIGPALNYSVIGGGYLNQIGSSHSKVGINFGDGNGIAAGAGNYIGQLAAGSFIGGGENNTIETNQTWATIPGGLENTIGPGSLKYATIGGGHLNQIGGSRPSAAIFAGEANAIAAGAINFISGDVAGSFIGGGFTNSIWQNHATIGGGFGNYVGTFGYGATVAGGLSNKVDGTYSTIAGGVNNSALGLVSTVAGGANNFINGNATGSFAAGRNCFINHSGSFMWSDGTLAFGTVAANSFNALAVGGYNLYTGSGVGVQVAAGGNAWSQISDRNVKENFRRVDGKAVLEKVVALPVTTWNLKTQSPEVRHIGAMAQDFKAAFEVGEDDRHISTSDADGVALAAIQGLNQKMEEQRAELKQKHFEITELKQKNSSLEQRLEALEKIIRNQKSN